MAVSDSEALSEYTIVQGPTKWDLAVATFEHSFPSLPTVYFVTKDGKRDSRLYIVIQSVRPDGLRQRFQIEGRAIFDDQRHLQIQPDWENGSWYRASVSYDPGKKEGVVQLTERLPKVVRQPLRKRGV